MSGKTVRLILAVAFVAILFQIPESRAVYLDPTNFPMRPGKIYAIRAPVEKPVPPIWEGKSKFNLDFYTSKL